MNQNQNLFLIISPERIYSNFKKSLENFNLNEFGPFVHGTTKEIGKIVEKEGLKTRKDRKDNKNIWSSFNKSQDDLIYFASNMDNTSMPIIACSKTIKKDIYTIDEINNNCCLFQLLRDFVNNQKHRFRCDEDTPVSKYKDLLIDYYSKKKGDFIQIAPILVNMPKFLIHNYNKAFLIENYDLLKRLVNETPEYFFSLCDWGTIAVKGSINPVNLKKITPKEYNEIKYFDNGISWSDKEVYYGHANKHFRQREGHMKEFRKELIVLMKND